MRRQFHLCQQDSVGKKKGKHSIFYLKKLHFLRHLSWRRAHLLHLFLRVLFLPLQAKKPLMEKMRRARINDSLNELKSLVLDLLQKDVSKTSHSI